MSDEVTGARRVIGVEEHVWTADLRDALLRFGGDDTVNMLSSREQTDHRLREVGEERLARMDAAGVGMQVLSITTPGTQPLAAAEAVPLARDANDFLADAVRAHPDRFAALATLPTPDPEAAARELERGVTELGLLGAQLVPLTGERYLDHDSFRPVFEAAAALGVPLYIHPGQPLRVVREAIYGGFDDWTNLNLATGGWGWHADAGLATLRLILAGTFDRHPDLQLILGRWGEMLVPFADRADLLSVENVHLERRVIDYLTGNLNVTAGGVLSHRMLTMAVDVLGPDRVMFGDDDPYRGMKGQFGGDGGAQSFVDTAPLGLQDKEKLAHLSAERLLGL
ncbi:amidohydrolase family protein [Amycolatopsis pithecellobii]|uniref:Amidohydrolase family protein n=1 Tax=Amycolatopsis pithecellobii TaxID=664692 RepID=A0A6N7Z0H7_9PSEU|nr:amidohydrolase family protein [Amycolatopsis pithecellobii]MTD52954.1 amidohydrolase family protein [Amycolatopsis pithecellobii]